MPPKQNIWIQKQDAAVVMEFSCGLKLDLQAGSAEKRHLCCRHRHTRQKHIGHKQS